MPSFSASVSIRPPSRLSLFLLLLFLFSAGAARGQGAAGQAVPGSITVRSGDTQVILSPADLAKIARRDLRVVMKNSTDSATVSGVALWDILQQADVLSSEASGRQRGVMYVRLTGADGQGALFALAEVDPGFTSRTVLVADRRNGQLLDASEGPWRVFTREDLRQARWVRGLATIEVGVLK